MFVGAGAGGIGVAAAQARLDEAEQRRVLDGDGLVGADERTDEGARAERRRRRDEGLEGISREVHRPVERRRRRRRGRDVRFRRVLAKVQLAAGPATPRAVRTRQEKALVLARA